MAASAYFLTEEDVAVLKQLVAERRAASSNLRGRPWVPEQPGAAPEVYLARAPAGGIAAIDENTTGTAGTALNDDQPASGDCEVYFSDDGTMTDAGFSKTAGNLSTTAIAAYGWVALVRDKFGSWVALPVGGGSGSPGGGQYDVQTNDGSGGFHGDDSFTWKPTTNGVTVLAPSSPNSTTGGINVENGAGGVNVFAHLGNNAAGITYRAGVFIGDNAGDDFLTLLAYKSAASDRAAGRFDMVSTGRYAQLAGSDDTTDFAGRFNDQAGHSLDLCDGTFALNVTAGGANFKDVVGGLSVGGTPGVSGGPSPAGVTAKRGLVTALDTGNTALKYTSTVPGSWTTSAPTNVRDALDRLIQGLVANGGSA